MVSNTKVNGTSNIGGVTFDNRRIKSANEITAGTYRVELKNGDIFTYKKQKGATLEMSDIGDNEVYYGMKNFKGLHFKANNPARDRLIISGGENNYIDMRNGHWDDVDVHSSPNSTILFDDKDRLYSTVRQDESYSDYTYDPSRQEKKIHKFVTKSKADIENFVKRENVPKSLVKTYDKIAAKNKNTILDTTKELQAFTNKVRVAYTKKQISEAELKKMGYGHYDAHTKDYEDYPVYGYYIGKALMLDVPLFSEIPGAAGVLIGGGVALTREAYDAITNTNYETRVTHWGIYDGNINNKSRLNHFKYAK